MIRPMKRLPKRRSVILRLALLIFAVYCVITLTQLQVQLIGDKKRAAQAQASVTELQQSNAALQQLLAKGSLNDLIEKAARDKYDYVYPNETQYTGN